MAKTKKVKRESQATPLAESYLAKLQKQLKSDAFGTGFGPLQRQAGDATGKLLLSLQNYNPDLDGNLGDFLSKVGQDGGGGFKDLLGSLEGFDTSVSIGENAAQTSAVTGFGDLDALLSDFLTSGGYKVDAKENAAQTRGVKGFGELESQIAELLASGGLDVDAREQGQQVAGKGNINKLISSLFGGTEGGPSRGNERLIRGLESSSKSRTDRSAADLREQGGIFGTRFGTSLATGDALLRSEAGASLDQTIGALLEQGRQFDTAQLQEAINEQFGQGTTLRDQDFRNIQTSQENRFRGRDQRSDVLSRLFSSGTTLRDQEFRNLQTSQENRFRGVDQRSNVLTSLFDSGTTLNNQEFRDRQSSVNNELAKLGIQSDVTKNMSDAELDRLRIEGEALNAEFNQRLAKERFNLDLNGQQIEVIKMMHSQGMANIAVFQQMATLGILPEEVVQSPGFWDYMTSLSGSAAAVVGAAG